MVSGTPPEFGERWGWWWIRWVMLIAHLILTVFSVGSFIFLCVVTSSMKPKTTPPFAASIILTFVASIYGLVGCITFCTSNYKWGRALAVSSVLVLFIYFFTLIGLLHCSIMCGIRTLKNETLVVTFKEDRIERCDWEFTSCLVAFPDDLVETCPTIHFLRLVNKELGLDHRGLVVKRIVDMGVLYHIFFLSLLLISLLLSMLLGVRERVIFPPAGMRAQVPITCIV